MPGLFRTATLLAGGATAAIVVNRLRREQNVTDFHDKVAVITGGSRGLGLGLAEGLARSGAKVAICARTADDLDRARRHLESLGAEVLAVPCDIGVAGEVEQFIDQVRQRFGRIDILINNAGIISVGPLLNQSVEDFERAMDVMFWGAVRATLAVIPEMVERGSGNIVNITSIGGKLTVPHLSAYTTAKYAAVGFSQSVTADLAGTGVRVTTVVPGLMRTGSYRNALFKGQHGMEYTWFGVGASLPVLTASVPTVVERILTATRRGDAVAMLDLKTHIGTRLFDLIPDSAMSLMGLINRIMPDPVPEGDRLLPGHQCETPLTQSFLTALGREAGERYNQMGS